MSDLIKYGVLAAVGYYVYKNYYQAPAVTTTTAPAPTVAYTAPTSTSLLNKAAQSQPDYIRNGGQMTADQWSYIWVNSLSKSAVDGGTFDALFFPNGRPTNATDTPKMTAAQFVAALGTAGLSGFRAVTGLPHPMVFRRRRVA